MPSVPRGLLLPVLDTYKMRDEELPDPTPPGSHVSADHSTPRKMVVNTAGGALRPSASRAWFAVAVICIVL